MLIHSPNSILTSLLDELNIVTIEHYTLDRMIKIIDDYREEVMEGSYNEGYTAGYKEGFDVGYDAGVYAEQGL